jgi:hypothetical protein
MGFLRWLLGGRSAADHGATPESHAQFRGPGDFQARVVGTAKHQAAIEALTGARGKRAVQVFVQAMLVFDNDDPHDRNAVQVFVGGRLVGYLRREDAKSYRQQILKAGRGEMVGCCSAKIVGGQDGGPDDPDYFGVRVDLPHK